MSSDKSSLGDRMKFLEGFEADRCAMPMIPLLARLDGRTFSSFTRGLERPYDIRLTRAMQATTKYLVDAFNAICGYCQSDEISLAWYEPEMGPDGTSKLLFDGRIQKLTSSLSASASVFFNNYIREALPEEYQKKMPTFDCRVWSVPTQMEAANAFVWREWDAHKNSVSMAAQHYFSHAELQGKRREEMQEMLFQQKGINYNNFPAFFKSGSFFVRRTVTRKFDHKLDDDLPEKHHARTNPNLEFTRNEIRYLEMPRFSRVTNRVDVLFNGADPVWSADSLGE